MLLELGYDAPGLYLGLGIGGYSDRSGEVTKAFAAERGAELIVVDLERDYGYDIPTAGRKGSRSTCAVCGLSKRYVFNRAALEGGFDVIATGHNLDDEAATLLGNTLRWQTEYIARQIAGAAREGRHGEEGEAAVPALRAGDRRVRVPAGHRLRRRGVPARGRQHAAPVQGRHERHRGDVAGDEGPVLPGVPRARAAPVPAADDAELSACERCGQPTTGRFCAFCRARAQILGERLGPPDGGQEIESVASELSDEVMPAEIYGGAS